MEKSKSRRVEKGKTDWEWGQGAILNRVDIVEGPWPSDPEGQYFQGTDTEARRQECA